MAQGQGEGPSASLRAWDRSHPERRQDHEGGPACRGMPAALITTDFAPCKGGTNIHSNTAQSSVTKHIQVIQH